MSLSQDLFNEMSKSDAPFNKRVPIDTMEKPVRRRNYREFVDRFRAVMAVVRAQNINMFIQGDQQYFDDLFSLWFKVLEKQSFQLGAGDEVLFTLNANITNLLAVTSHKNGDECIKKIINQPENMGKLLLLYTPRSQLEIPVKPLFDANPLLASLWYSCLWNWADTYVHPAVQRNYEYFLENADPRFEPFDSDLICGYFRCTYVNNFKDRILKRVFNRAIARYSAGATIHNNPNPKSIAVVSAFWNGQHAVYRAFAPYVVEMAKHYDLTLVDLSPPGRLKTEPSLFKKVYKIEASPTKIDISSIMHNNFQLAYFPDVGMAQESVYLANMRIAPIQCMGTGHPVSSAATQMDYFMSGAEVETTDEPERNYDERLVLLPGLSVHPIRPKYALQNAPLPTQFIINLPWMHMKNNNQVTQVLRRILDAAQHPIFFSIFPGCGATNNSSFMVTMQDFANYLPEGTYIIQPDLSYNDYMGRQERGRFTMHSYPFGGGTTAVDSFVLGKPLTVLRGRHEYNRYPATLLTRLGMQELIADSVDQWVEICTRLINDTAYLDDVTARLKAIDLDKVLFRLADASHLRRAFDHLIKHNESLRKDTSRKPILID